MRTNSTVNATGNPLIIFEYNDGFGWVTFDQVSLSINDMPLVDSNMVVDGSQFTPNGFYKDAELIVGGDLGGATTVDQQSDLIMSIDYQSGQASEPINDSYNYGSNTAETISHVLDKTNGTSTDDNILTAGSGSLAADEGSHPSIGYPMIASTLGIATVTIMAVVVVTMRKGKLRASS